MICMFWVTNCLFRTPVPIKATGALKSQVDKALKATYVKLHNGLTT